MSTVTSKSRLPVRPGTHCWRCCRRSSAFPRIVVGRAKEMHLLPLPLSLPRSLPLSHALTQCGPSPVIPRRCMQLADHIPGRGCGTRSDTRPNPDISPGSTSLSCAPRCVRPPPAPSHVFCARKPAAVNFRVSLCPFTFAPQCIPKDRAMSDSEL